MNGKDTGTPKSITVLALRRRLRETLDRIVYLDERFVVTRNGEQVAVIVGVEAYRRLMGVGEEANGKSLRDG